MLALTSTNLFIRVRWKGLSEPLSDRKKPLEGLCMGLFVRYPCGHLHTQQFPSLPKAMKEVEASNFDMLRVM